MTESKEIIVLVTAPPTEAESLAETLVEEALVACVNILPGVKSIYRWQGSLCKDQECLLLMKTSSRLWDKLATRITELHSYDLPEILALPIELGSQAYLDWLGAALQPKEEPKSIF